jgi:hypothetical protein
VDFHGNSVLIFCYKFDHEGCMMETSVYLHVTVVHNLLQFWKYKTNWLTNGPTVW